MLIKDLHPSKIPTGNWNNARNILYKNSAIFQEPGFEKFSDEFEDRFIGGIKLNEDFVIFTAGNTSGIYRVSKTGVTSPIIVDDVLNFSLDNPIFGVFQRNYKKEVIIAWWDGVKDDSNPPRVLNIDDIPFDLNIDSSLVNPEDIDLLNLNINSVAPKISLDNVSDIGGNLKTGMYSVFTFYEFDDGTRFGYNIIGSVIPIYDRPIENELNIDAVTGTTYVFDGCDGGLDTTKSIEITLTDLDTRFAKVGVGLIGVQNSVVVSFIDRVENITSTSESFVLTGNTGIIEDIDLDTLLVPPIVYTGARSGTVFNKELYLFNLKKDSDIPSEFQAIANDISVLYKYNADEENLIGVAYEDALRGYQEPKVVHDRRTYTPNEVCALYAGFVTANGEIICHIPGRVHRDGVTIFHDSDDGTTSLLPTGDPVVASERDLISDVIAANGDNLQNLEQAVLVDPNARMFQFFDTSDNTVGGLGEGLLGYWENKDEVYPADFPDFAGQNVRHHKMPSLGALYRSHGTHEIDTRHAEKALGLVFDVTIPPAYQDVILAVKFYYAKRETSSVLGMAIGKPHDETTPYTTGDFDGVVRFQDMNLIYNKPVLSMSYIRGEYIRRTADPDLVSDDADMITYQLCGTDTAETPFMPIRKVDKAVYIPGDIVTPDADNTNREETIYVEFDDQIIFSTAVDGGGNFEVVMFTMMRHLVNIYQDYANQELAFTGTIVYPTDTLTDIIVYGGDSYVTPYSDRTIQLIGGDSGENVLTVITPIYSAINHWLRQRVDELTLFHPYGTGATVGPFAYEHNYAYNYDFTKTNSFFPYRELISDGSDLSQEDSVDKFPYRIARSVKQTDESTQIGWRVFLANDYYENVRRVGEGVAIRTLSRAIVIQHEYGLFVAVARDKLSANNIEISLGSGDIFQSPPDEIIPEDSGYFGSRHQASCNITKAGYLAVDDVQGKVLLFGGSADEISVYGIRDFMIRYGECNVSEDNPYNGDGWLSGFDEENNRILITKWFGLSVPSNSTVSNYNVFTLSYNLDPNSKGWVCLHDYAPNAYLYNRSGLFSLRNLAAGNYMWKHNVDNIATFYNEEVKESIIDYIISADSFFKLTGLEWDTVAWNPITGAYNEFETISKIAVFNDKQCTGLIELFYDEVRNVALGSKNVSPYRNVWTFNKVRDTVIDRSQAVIDDKGVLNTGNFDPQISFHKKLKLIGKFCIIRFVWSNVTQTRVELYNVNINNRKVQR